MMVAMTATPQRDDDEHVRVYMRRRVLAADLLLIHARLCPICITRGAHACSLGEPLALVIEGKR